MLPHTNPTPTTAQKTGIELRAQILDYIHDSIATSDLKIGWRLNTPPDAPAWDPATITYGGLSCSTTQPTDQQQFVQYVFHDPVEDPLALAAKVSTHWENQGYKVSNVVTPITEPGKRRVELRADTPNGATLGLFVSDQIVSFDASTECSTDPSLDLITGPNGYEHLPEIAGTSEPE